jgi:hypothetical protein
VNLCPKYAHFTEGSPYLCKRAYTPHNQSCKHLIHEGTVNLQSAAFVFNEAKPFELPRWHLRKPKQHCALAERAIDLDQLRLISLQLRFSPAAQQVDRL